MNEPSSLSLPIPHLYRDVVVVCAGASRRMGSPKALLRFSEDETFLEHVLGVYRDLGFHIVLVLSEEGVRTLASTRVIKQTDAIVVNAVPERGRIHSISIGLAQTRAGAHVFVQDVDRPFVTTELINALSARPSIFGYTVPVYEGKTGHPVMTSPHVVKSLRANDADDLRSALAPFPRLAVPWDDLRCGVNINTLADYERVYGSFEEALT